MGNISYENDMQVIREKGVIHRTNCITGDNDHLIDRLREAFKKAKSIDIIVAFLMESGVKLLKDDLKEAMARGVKIRILTGNYLNITQPQALYLLRDILGDEVDIRFYNVPNRSFHPKAYIFHFEETQGEIYVGSSNISNSALTSGIEWNYRLDTDGNLEDFNHFYNTFEDLFLNQSIIVDENEMRKYSERWVRPRVYKDLEKIENEEKEDTNVIPLFEPRGAQIEALYNLKKSREEGADKGIVIAATGIGKTYLAAFDSLGFKRVLFVVHREEIIRQAAQSFKNIRPNDSQGFFYGQEKDTDKDLIFALVQSLGKKDNLREETFPRDYFDYIVIDEFHHAVAGNYKNIIEYFKPKFLLGLTATPERLDNKDVFALCDYNSVYEVRLKEAINKGWLVPFRYYGIFDDTVDYTSIEFKNGKYNNAELEKALSLEKRAELIFNHYKKYNSKTALGFCTSRNHAEYMAKYFSEKGVAAYSVYSGDGEEYRKDREEAVTELKNGKLKIIFSVDMFNEGLDVPSVDLVLFLRPTESSTIFLQQLGRGLRKYKDKQYLNVLDFIGNYKKANKIPSLISGNPGGNSGGTGGNEEFPEDCIVDFDFRLVDLFRQMDQREKGIKQLIIEDFNRVKEELGYAPSRVELFTYMDEEVYALTRKSGKDNNIFANYFNFLEEANSLSDEEAGLKGTIAECFINMIETTSMSKTYKLPILLAFYCQGNIKLKIDEEDIYIAMRDFYGKGSNGVDMLKDKSTKDYKIWDKKKYVSLAKNNPIKAFTKTHGDFFRSEGKEVFLNKELGEFLDNEAFIKNVKDAIEFRNKQYYKTRFSEKN